MFDSSLTEKQRLLEHTICEWARGVGLTIREFDAPSPEVRAAIVDGVKRFVADRVTLGFICEELGYIDASLREIVTEYSLTEIVGLRADDLRRFTAAAGSAGLIRACRDASFAYVQEHRAADRSHPLLAGMESDYRVSRALWLRSAAAPSPGSDADLAFSFAIAAAERAAVDAVQLHGANGYSNQYPVGRFLRNARAASRLLAAPPLTRPAPAIVPNRLPHIIH